MTNAQTPSARLTPEQLEEFGKAMDEIRQRVVAELGHDPLTDLVHRLAELLELLGGEPGAGGLCVGHDVLSLTVVAARRLQLDDAVADRRRDADLDVLVGLVGL